MHIAITLVERDFLCGAAALYNSLVAQGFTGRYIIGYRGDSDVPSDLLQRMRSLPADLPSIEWVELDTPWHFTNYKARFIADIFTAFPEAKSVTYLDPDIVVTCLWAWIQSWSDHGPALCGDVNWWMPPDHPTRHEWERLLKSKGFEVHQQLHAYFNGGFVSIRRSHLEFVERWHSLIESCSKGSEIIGAKGEIHQLSRGGRSRPIQTLDQDSLNLTAMTWEGKLTTLGPDAMGFFDGGWIFLPHALGPGKPWQKSYLLSALKGERLRRVDHAYWFHASDPIKLKPRSRLRLKRLEMKAAAFVGRFYSR